MTDNHSRRIALSLPFVICTPIAALLVGCNGPAACAGLGRPDVIVTVLDSLTGAPAADGATLLTVDLDAGGARVDSVTGQSNAAMLVGTGEGPGRFSVVVRKAGYRDWTKAEVIVRDGCPSIHTVSLTARLARP
jgi:hypothetical protein